MPGVLECWSISRNWVQRLCVQRWRLGPLHRCETFGPSLRSAQWQWYPVLPPAEGPDLDPLYGTEKEALAGLWWRLAEEAEYLLEDAKKDYERSETHEQETR